MTIARPRPLELTRTQVLAHRRAAGSLDERLPAGTGSLRGAARAGLPDSMPRAAILGIHARVAGVVPDVLDDPALVQVWGPRFSSYVVAADDVAPFTLGRLPDEPGPLRRAEQTADELDAFLAGRRMTYSEAGHAMGVNPNDLRYATTTGRILIRWEGAGRPVVWTVPPPSMAPEEARLELARRFFHALGPGSAESFSNWAGIRSPRAGRIVRALEPELLPVRTPVGERWILAVDEPSFRGHTAATAPAPARLLPSGDTFVILQGVDRELVVPDPARRAELWTSRVWPGALLVAGDVAGVWRRAGSIVDVSTWRTLTPAERAAVEAEAASFPLPGIEGKIQVRWDP